MVFFCGVLLFAFFPCRILERDALAADPRLGFERTPRDKQNAVEYLCSFARYPSPSAGAAGGHRPPNSWLRSHAHIMVPAATSTPAAGSGGKADVKKNFEVRGNNTSHLNCWQAAPRLRWRCEAVELAS